MKQRRVGRRKHAAAPLAQPTGALAHAVRAAAWNQGAAEGRKTSSPTAVGAGRRHPPRRSWPLLPARASRRHREETKLHLKHGAAGVEAQCPQLGVGQCTPRALRNRRGAWVWRPADALRETRLHRSGVGAQRFGFKPSIQLGHEARGGAGHAAWPCTPSLRRGGRAAHPARYATGETPLRAADDERAPVAGDGGEDGRQPPRHRKGVRL